MADYIQLFYLQRWDLNHGCFELTTLDEFSTFIIDDLNDEVTAKLWPQIWAMSQVYPAMHVTMHNVYQPYLNTLIKLLPGDNKKQKRQDAIAIMAMLEGLSLFVGKGRPWEKDRKAVKKRVVDLLNQWGNSD